MRCRIVDDDIGGCCWRRGVNKTPRCKQSQLTRGPIACVKIRARARAATRSTNAVPSDKQAGSKVAYAKVAGQCLSSAENIIQWRFCIVLFCGTACIQLLYLHLPLPRDLQL